jgi:hypothetical protein
MESVDTNFSVSSREEPRMHVHVICAARNRSSGWIPPVEFASSFGMSGRQRQHATANIEEHGDEFRAAWHRRFDD